MKLMNSDMAIMVENLSKKFCTNLQLGMIYGLRDMLKDWRGIVDGRDNLRRSEFWALKDVNFELMRGQTLGIIGRNGAGKTTLLRMLNGIYPPDHGRIQIAGKLSPLISTGLGFHRHLTGRQNIFISGAVRGMAQKEIRSKLDSIIDFAGIGEFIDAPVATYSKGMLMRLGFSIATHCPVEILLIDEALAVGDMKFRVKCYDKILELKSQGVTTLLVSHVMGWINAYSDKVLLMDKGKIIHFGDVKTGVGIYLKNYMEIGKDDEKHGEFDEEEHQILKVVTGTDEFVIEKVKFTPELNKGTINMNRGDDLTVTVDYTAYRDFFDVRTNAILSTPGKSDRHVFQCKNHDINKRIDIKQGKGSLSATIKNVNLNNYRVDFQFSMSVDQTVHVLWWKQIPVYVEGNPSFNAFLHLDMDYEVHSNE